MEKLNYLFFLEKDIKNIITASQNNKLVFFIGSGFSKFSETELIKTPNWGELINELTEDLNISNESDYLKIAQLYFLKFGQHAYTNKVKSSIKDLAPSEFHKSLFDLNPHYIITTNWDNLIEKTIQEKGLAYDLICSDMDLAHSQLDKKIIKMHGDFQQHNFVFKEDDYLRYSQNFPLIESYIKSIFSTCTIVFLGYSYSDYNLKQIVSWITSISKATPKKYLLQGVFDETQNKYLENHGISILSPIIPKISYKELYEIFFEDLNVIKNQDKLIIRIVNIVQSKIDEMEKDTSISESFKNNEKKKIDQFLIDKAIKYFSDKVSPLAQYQILLPELIQKKLTNSAFSYEGSDLILNILSDKPDDYLTYDFNEKIRYLNSFYIDRILNVDSQYSEKLLSILNKASITKIQANDRLYDIKKISNDLKDDFLKKLYFEYTSNDIEILLSNEKYEELLKYFSGKVQYYLNKKNYIMATISMANHDFIYDILKFSASNKYNLHHDTSKKIIESATPFNYKNKVRDFPEAMQQDLQDLLQFLDLTKIYETYYKLNTESQKNKALAQQRKEGGMSWSNDEYTLRAKLYPYVYFILGNDMLIEQYRETRQLFESTILESFEHYLINDKFFINITDLFIIIKYCDEKKVRAFSNKLINSGKFNSICHLKPKHIDQIKKYLLKTLNNICKSLGFKNKNNLHTTFIDKPFNNILTVLGFVKWKPKEFKRIIDTIIPVYKLRTRGTSIYENIEYFLGVSWNLYKNSHPDIVNILDITLSKIIKNEFNGYDSFTLEGGILSNVYNISINKKHTYKNIILVKKALNEIKEYEDESRQFFIDYLLLKISRIGSKEVKELIESFINENILTIPCKKPNDFISKLILICNGYTIPDGFIKDLEHFINENIPKNLLELDFLRADIQSEFPRLLKYLVEDKKLIAFESILKQFEDNMKTFPKNIDR